jgi:hypothetical protein
MPKHRPTNMTSLLEEIELLKNELELLGAPNSLVRSITDLKPSIDYVIKHRV